MRSAADKGKRWRVTKVQSNEVQLCKRWVVVYDHDGSPVEGCCFMHANKAEAFVAEQKHPEKFRVAQAALMPNAMAEKLLFG